ncbi:MAG: ECF-type sigma factor [Balneolaceae bacterium]|nr:ECF-type sigma factor [Balneolaceae bacterium]
MRDKSKITRLLIDLRQSEQTSDEEFFPVVYDELKNLAYSKLQNEYDNITLTETGLVHEVYLKMIDQTMIEAKDKSHFLAIAARCMRQILVDHARKRKAEKRGGDQQDVTYIDRLLRVYEESGEVIDLDEKLNELAQLNKRMADVVTLRFFGQMSVHDTAQALGISDRTVKRDWTKARGWLYKELKDKF